MSRIEKMPLIAYFLWSNEEPGQINFVIQRILNIFIKYISIGYASEKIDIITVSEVLK